MLLPNLFAISNSPRYYDVGQPRGIAMRTTLTLAAVLFVAAPSAAQSMLLAEIGLISPEEEIATVPAHFSLGAAIHPPGQPPFEPTNAAWHVQDVMDLNQTFVAPPDVVAEFNFIMTHSQLGAGIHMSNDGYCGTLHQCLFGRGFSLIIGGPNNDWAGGPYNIEGWYGLAHVPPKAPFSLAGYEITAMERTIAPTSQIVRFYGQPIPEPATLLLACIALCCCLRPHR